MYSSNITSARPILAILVFCLCIKSISASEPHLVELRGRLPPSRLQSVGGTGAQGGSGYIGCWHDPTEDGGTYTLSDDMDVETYMDIPTCWNYCSGYAYFGVLGDDTCLCGDNVNPSAYAAPCQDDCSQPCAGDATTLCGGPYRVALYQADSDPNPPVNSGTCAPTSTTLTTTSTTTSVTTTTTTGTSSTSSGSDSSSTTTDTTTTASSSSSSSSTTTDTTTTASSWSLSTTTDTATTASSSSSSTTTDTITTTSSSSSSSSSLVSTSISTSQSTSTSDSTGTIASTSSTSTTASTISTISHLPTTLPHLCPSSNNLTAASTDGTPFRIHCNAYYADPQTGYAYVSSLRECLNLCGAFEAAFPGQCRAVVFSPERSQCSFKSSARYLVRGSGMPGAANAAENLRPEVGSPSSTSHTRYLPSATTKSASHGGKSTVTQLVGCPITRGAFTRGSSLACTYTKMGNDPQFMTVCSLKTREVTLATGFSMDDDFAESLAYLDPTVAGAMKTNSIVITGSVATSTAR